MIKIPFSSWYNTREDTVPGSLFLEYRDRLTVTSKIQTIVGVLTRIFV